MKGNNLKIVIFMLSFVSVNAFGEDLELANKLFAKRGQEENLVAAKKIYREVIKNSKVLEHRIQAFDRFARLSVLQGELGLYVYGKAAKNPSQVYEECISLSSALSKESIGAIIPEYVYWRATCIGLWANEAGILSISMKLSLVREMSEHIEFGQQHFPDFEGGAFSMLAAGLRVRSRLLKLINYYDPEKAISLLEPMLGTQINNYMVFLLKAEAQKALGRKDDAQATLQEALRDIEHRKTMGTLHPLSEVESLGFLKMLKAKI